MTHRRSASMTNSSFRCSESDVTEVYMCPRMQHHPPRSREVFRHWWVTIIKTPKVRKMTKATLFLIHFMLRIILKQWCCRLCRPPLLPLPQTNQQAPQRAGHQAEERGVCWRKILCFIFKKNCWKYIRTIQLPLAWQVCVETGILKQEKSNITTCDVTARSFLSFLTFLSTWHTKKTPHFVPGI